MTEATTRPIEPRPWDGSQTIHIVEDNPDDVLVTLKALKACHPDAGISVSTDGFQAMEFHGKLIAGEVGPPALMFLDLKLPGLSGLDILAAYRQHDVTQDMVIVIVTSSNHEIDMQSAWALGANDYIQKPFDLDEYSMAIQSVCNMWLPAPPALA